MMPCRQHGFTALDLLVTMTLVAILISAGVPALREYSLNQNMKSAVSLLFSDLRLARMDAISLNARVVACPAQSGSGCEAESAWHYGWLVFADLNGDDRLQDLEPVLRRSPPVEGVSITSPASRSFVRFLPGGTAPGSNASIVFCDSRGHSDGKKLVISNSGRIRTSVLENGDKGRCPQS